MQDDQQEDEEDNDAAEVENALADYHLQSSVSPVPSARERELERTNAILRSQVEQVRLLVLGLDKRLLEREEHLGKTIQRAERETKGLDAKLRDFDLNLNQA
jgi:hypothetical protein